MALEIGDMAAANGKVGEVIDIDDITGGPVIRPFPALGQEGLGECIPFTGTEDIKLVKKHWEWENSAIRRARAAAEDLSARYERWAEAHTEREGAIYRGYYEQQQAQAADRSFDR